MLLTTVNVEDPELHKLLSVRDIHKGKKVSFFDWVPTNSKSTLVANQIEEMKRCQEQGIPVIVFDRHSTMTGDEIMFLHKKTKAILLEPSVVTRPGFQFMPYWIHFRDYKYSDFQENRKFQTGYKGARFTKDTESCILNVIKDGVTVGVDTKLPSDKYDVLKSIVSVGKYEYEDFDTMILTGTQDEYNRGILPDIRQLMEYGTIPLLFHKHKWLHSLFRHFVIYSHADIRWASKFYQNCGVGFIEDIQKQILEYLPEMEANNFVDSLLAKAEKL